MTILDGHACPDLLTQAKFLAGYISRQGAVLIAENDVGKTKDRHDAYAALLAQIESSEKNGISPEQETALRSAYQAITEFTFAEKNVNGLTVWESAQTRLSVQEGDKESFVGFFWPVCRCIFRAHNFPLLAGIALLIAVFTLISKGACIGTTASLVSIDKYLIPMCWGAIGTTAYVLKRTTDARNNESYSRLRLAGYGTRIFLGAMFGLLIVEAFADKISGTDGVTNDKLPFVATTAVVAFTAGLGIKPVYAAFEQIAIQLSDRITGKKTPTT